MSFLSHPSLGAPNADYSGQRWFLITIALLGIIIGYSLGTMHANSLLRAPSSDNADTDPYAGSSSEESADSNSSSSTSVGLPPDVSDTDHIRGDRNAPIALIEYSDLQCPYCKDAHPTLQQVLQEYPGKVMWVYRHYPLSFHENATQAAEATECVAELGGNDAFWKFVDLIFAKQAEFEATVDNLKTWAKDVGVDEAAFASCLQNGKFAKNVADEQAAAEEAGVEGTPGIYLLNVKTKDMEYVDGAYPLATFKESIDKLLQ